MTAEHVRDQLPRATRVLTGFNTPRSKHRVETEPQSSLEQDH